MTLSRWDIFCHVVDNFGDIGVCWRLARQLAGEHGLAVRLWVDDL
ncbi:MAG: elongation factor P maturation arginine rhamnosyltransferase EarP, partial [Zoogloeaceae bacterium]|nr:elongation factor P maturation arginine rhamnosyltransferase EarP [Zoogloeaceae bacterium]